MSLAAATREAAADHPWLVTAMRAGICNYTAAARFLEVDGETEAVATALRRYADDLSSYDTTSRQARVTMESGMGPVDEPDDAILSIGGTSLGAGSGDYTAIVATGDVDATALATILERLAVEGLAVTAAGVAAETAVVVVGRRDGATAVRAVERALETVPNEE